MRKVLLAWVIGLFLGKEASAVVINEFVFNHVGTDTFEFVELFGAPSTDISNLTLLQIDGDGTVAGIIDTAFPGGVTDAGGFWTTGFQNNEFENGSVSLFLVDAFTGAVGNDLDTNNDGTFDSTPWMSVIDTIAVSDGGVSDRVYGGVVLLPGADGFPFVFAGASRIPNGIDTDTAGDWVRNDFDLAGIAGFSGTPVQGEAFNTPGSINRAVPEPSTLLLLGTGLIALAGRLRRRP